MHEIYHTGYILVTSFFPSCDKLNLYLFEIENYDQPILFDYRIQTKGFYDTLLKIGNSVAVFCCAIPDFQKDYHNLLQHAKKNGQVFIGDMQLASGFVSNPFTLLLVKKFGSKGEGSEQNLAIEAHVAEYGKPSSHR